MSTFALSPITGSAGASNPLGASLQGSTISGLSLGNAAATTNSSAVAPSTTSSANTSATSLANLAAGTLATPGALSTQTGQAIQGASLANNLTGANANVSSALGVAGGVLGLYNGIQQGGIQGDATAAIGGLKAGAGVANLAGDSALGAGLSTAAGYIAAPLSLYDFAKNYQSGATGSDALSGAEAGASIGSIVPGIGTAIGAVIGGAVGAISSAFGGGKQDPETLGTYAADSAGANAEEGQSAEGSFQYLTGILDAKGTSPTGSLEGTFGREGESNLLNGMAGQIDSAVSSGKIAANASPTTVFNTVIQPWLAQVAPKGVGAGSLTFTDAKGNSSGDNLQDALTNMAGDYMNGTLTSKTALDSGGQTDSSLPAFA
jgi:hypothetical protein